MAGKVSAQKDGDYTSIDGTSYTYNYAYTGNDGDSNYIGTGLYNLEVSKRTTTHPSTRMLPCTWMLTATPWLSRARPALLRIICL